MGVELEILATWENGEVFARIDTHKCLSPCYEDLFKLEKKEQINEISEWSLDSEYLSKMNDDQSYGDNLYTYNPAEILSIIYKNRNILKTTTVDLNNNFVDEFKDPRVQAAIGLLETLAKTNTTSEYKIVLRWS